MTMSAPVSAAVKGFFCRATRPLISLSLSTLRPKVGTESPPHPVAKYCMATRMAVEVTQYRERPLGKERPRKANMSGIIHCISSLCARC